MRTLRPLLLLLSIGCTVPALQLEGLGCDEQGRCLEGFVCLAGRCVAPDSAPDAEEPPCEPEEFRSCGSDVGECWPGVQTCSAQGVFGECVGATGPSAELCDGDDNDCDGLTDEQDDDLQSASCPLTVGVCAQAVEPCVGGTAQPCTATVYGDGYEPLESSCDGKDNDCDGQVDEGMDEDQDRWGVPGVTCALGTDDCDDGDPLVFPGAGERCNGVDDDCDLDRDEGFGCSLGELGAECQTACETASVEVCATDCSTLVCAAPPERCNGEDDDCDDLEDDGLNSGLVTVGYASGSPAVAAVGVSTGGFLVAWPRLDAGTATVGLARVGRDAVPEGIESPVVGGAARLPALTEKHLAWVEKSGTQDLVRFTDLRGGRIGAEISLLITSTPAISSLQALRSGDDSLLAVGYASGSHLVLYQLGASSGLLADLPGGSDLLSAPAFGTIGGKATLYFERADTDGLSHLLHAHQLVGEVSNKELDLPAQSIPPQPAAAAEVLVHRVATTCVSCPDGKGAQVRLTRMLASAVPGASIDLSEAQAVAEQPRVAALGGDTYLVTWVDASAVPARLNMVRVAWNSATSVWRAPSMVTGLTAPSRTLHQTAVAADDLGFLATFDAVDGLGGFELFTRASCP